MTAAPGPYARWTRGPVQREAGRDASPAASAGLLLTWREIERRLPEVRTVLEVGAGVGRFSLELARRGCEVVHVEQDPAALAAAVAQARAERLRTVRFVRGGLPSLGWLKTGVFDLVLCLDGAVSFAYPRHKEATAELVRVSRRWILLGVVNRLAALRQWIESDLSFPAGEAQASRLLRDGIHDPGEAFAFFHPEALPPLYAFHPEEMRQTLEHLGCRVAHLCAPGALAATLDPAALARLLDAPARRAAFLALAAQYDANSAAMGTAPRELWGTLLATARRGPDALLFRPPSAPPR